MADVYSDMLDGPGRYLLGILEKEGSVPYSRFYNDDTDYRALTKEANLSETYWEHVHVLIEYAADQLVRKGLLTVTPLEIKLIDDENDFLITLTDKGREAIAANQIQFHDMYV